MQATIPTNKFMVDTYGDWAVGEGIPIYEGFGLDLLTLETMPWPRFGVKGAIVHVAGRGDDMTVFILDIPPGGHTVQQRHLFEASLYVLAGQGITTFERASGERGQFEWSAHSLFAPPLNMKYQIFNSSGRENARIAMSCNLPAVLNLFHNEDFVFRNTAHFIDREGPQNHFLGEGDFIPIRPGKNMWETNFVPDCANLKLHAWNDRGRGATHIALILADSVMHAHISEIPVGTYKKAHRHGPDAHIYIVSGEGYSLLFNEGDKDFIRVDWKPGWIFAPPDMMFHQHFNTSGEPARYLAFLQGNIRYPLNAGRRRVYAGVDKDVKTGGNQIEYQDQDPRIHETFVGELTRKGIALKMPASF